jgi:hypothetical protein
LRVEGEGKSGVVMLLRHYARCGITRTNAVPCAIASARRLGYSVHQQTRCL